MNPNDFFYYHFQNKIIVSYKTHTKIHFELEAPCNIELKNIYI